MKVQRYKCMNERCSYDQQERIPFATGSCSHTHRLARYVTDLLKAMGLKDVSGLMDVSWATIKDIHVRYLERHYSPPRRGTVYPESPKWKRMKVRIRRSGISRPDNKSPIYIIRWSISPLYIIRYGNRWPASSCQQISQLLPIAIGHQPTSNARHGNRRNKERKGKGYAGKKGNRRKEAVASQTEDIRNGRAERRW